MADLPSPLRAAGADATVEYGEQIYPLAAIDQMSFADRPSEFEPWRVRFETGANFTE